MEARSFIMSTSEADDKCNESRKVGYAEWGGWGRVSRGRGGERCVPCGGPTISSGSQLKLKPRISLCSNAP